MGFCINCGQTLAKGAHFCSNCGIAVGETNTGASQRKTVYDGELYKCPNCTERLDSFMTVCPTCGYELRGAKGASVVKEFAKKLEQIESVRTDTNKVYSVIGDIFGKFNKTDEQKINLIRSFSIPNTKEDIVEFVILAASNIDLRLYGFSGGDPNSSQRAISDAWLAKFEQAYDKARFSFANSPDFLNIKEIHDQKMKQLKKEKRNQTLIILSMVLFLLLGFILGFIALIFGAK